MGNKKGDGDTVASWITAMQNRLERLETPFTSVPDRFLALNPLLLGRLRISQSRAVDTQNAAPVYRSLEPAERAVDGLVIPKLDADSQCKYLANP